MIMGTDSKISKIRPRMHINCTTDRKNHKTENLIKVMLSKRPDREVLPFGKRSEK